MVFEKIWIKEKTKDIQRVSAKSSRKKKVVLQASVYLRAILVPWPTDD